MDFELKQEKKKLFQELLQKEIPNHYPSLSTVVKKLFVTRKGILNLIEKDYEFMSS